MAIWDEIRGRAEALREETARTLSQLVQIPSLSGEEQEAIQYLGEACERAGFAEVRVDGLGNLVARIGHGPRALAVDAHIDTVDTGDKTQWSRPPFAGLIEDGQVYGRGSVDQKGGAAAMVTAGRVLSELGYDQSHSLYFTFTVMEEDCDGLCWNYLIEEEKLIPEFAVITEPTNLGLYRGQRGRIEFEFQFGGVSAHGSAPERGDNAVYRASETALRVRDLNSRLAEDPFLGRGSIAVTMVRSDSPSLCAIPDQCFAHVDRRLTWGETRASALEELRSICDEKTTVTVPRYEKSSYRGVSYGQEKHFPTWVTAPDHPLVAGGKRTFQALFGYEPRVGRWVFSTNGVAISGRHGIPCIGFGPGNEVYAHAPNEAVPIAHLVKASAFYALLPYMMEEQE
jgi:putative selenium metabolism hydrolase